MKKKLFGKMFRVYPRRTGVVAWLCGLLIPCGLMASSGEPGGAGSANPGERIIEFAGFKWKVKNNVEREVGPGPNYFSDSERNVWVDAAGRLHLRIEQRGGKWYCAEIVSERAIGYGQLTCVIDGPVHEMDPSVVFGFFTWDTTTRVSDSNSEIDIEVTRWGQDQPEYPNLWYSVHPTYGPGSDDGRFRERFYGSLFEAQDPQTLHSITWEPGKIFWESYQGSKMEREHLIAAFAYNDASSNSKPRRSAYSEPFLAPRPGPATKVRFNLWLYQGQVPTDGQAVEVIISDFSFRGE
jgi:hypothetical protein